MKDQLATSIGRIDVFSKRLEANSLIGKRLDDINQIFERSTKPIQSPNDQRVSFPEDFKTGAQFLPVTILARQFFLKYLFAPRYGECIKLQFRPLVMR